MDQPAVDNLTEFAVYPQVLLDRDGEKLVAMVKASFELPRGAGQLEIAPAARTRGIRLADITWGEPEVSSIAYPADLCVRKPGTDVVVVGSAHAPRGEAAERFDARVEIGPLSKSVAIFGKRSWTGGGDSVTKPTPVSEVELRYELAFGGFDDSDPEHPVEEPRNPIGTGKTREASARAYQPAPQIEDPGALIGALAGDPAPAGLGAIGRHWAPRRDHAGTYDAAWTETRAPLPPMDFDDRYNLCASPGLTATPPLQGGEAVALWNLVPGGGATSFALPRIEVEVEFRVQGREPVVAKPHLDTVLLDLLEISNEKPLAVELVWRAEIVPPRNMNHVRIIVREREQA